MIAHEHNKREINKSSDELSNVGLCSRVRLNPSISVCCGDVIHPVVDEKNTCCGDLPYNPNTNECCQNGRNGKFRIVEKGFDCRR